MREGKEGKRREGKEGKEGRKEGRSFISKTQDSLFYAYQSHRSI